MTRVSRIGGRALPPGFLLGASTASYQIEGAVAEDGRGESIWDRFCHTPGRIANGDTGDIACDHYHRWREDLALAAGAGLDVYRFSIAWPRVLPSGAGAINQAGLAFYDRIVDTLLEAGVEPWPCLYHWDLPQALQDRGGWATRDCVEWFADYAMIVARRLGDRLEHLVLFNEPGVAAGNGYYSGTFAPGIKSPSQWAAAAHHLNLAAGRAFTRIKDLRPALRVGTVLHWNVIEPETSSVADAAAASRVDAHWHRAFFDPVLLGSYPEEVRPGIEPNILPGDLAAIRVPLDFLGVNYYTRFHVRAEGGAAFDAHIGLTHPDRPLPLNGLGWEVYPEGLRRVLVRLHREYRAPRLYVAETGFCSDEAPDAAGTVLDTARIAFLSDHLGAVLDAVSEGVDCCGFFVWSLLDNFEWAKGYRPRFGLVYIDYATQRRVPKASYHWWSQVSDNRMLPVKSG